jgi:hypothetical protein
MQRSPDANPRQSRGRLAPFPFAAAARSASRADYERSLKKKFAILKPGELQMSGLVASAAATLLLHAMTAQDAPELRPDRGRRGGEKAVESIAAAAKRASSPPGRRSR